MIVWKWLGKAGEFIPGVPPRDLTDEEVQRKGLENIVKASKLFKKVSPKNGDSKENE